MPAPRLPPDAVARIARGISTIVAARDEVLRPSVMRAVGSDVSADGSELAVYLSRPQSRQLLQDLATGSPVAVVFSRPSTHWTLQVKASQASLRDAGPGDEPVLARYLASMERELGAIGFPAAVTRALLAHRPGEVVVLGLRPGQAFDQTPGPRAGTPLDLGG